MGCSVQRRLRFQWVLTEPDPDWPDIKTRATIATHCLVRLMWLRVLLVLDHPPFYRDYRWRFGVSIHTFRRDKRKLRRVGMYIDAMLHGKVSTLLYLQSSSLE
jgi:hypothetical protein